MRHLLKLAYSEKDHEILIRYRAETDTGHVETVTLESAEEPAPELVEALAGLAPHVCALAELPREWAAQLTVRGVTVTRSEATGLTITALRKLKNLMTPLVINTPYTTEFGAACQTALDELERQALAFVDGERAQLELDLAAAN